MNTNTPQHPLVSQLHDEAREAGQSASAAAQDLATQAAQSAKEALHTASDAAKDAYQNVRARTEDTLQHVRSKAEDTYQNVRAKADETYRTVRAKADETAVATGQYVRQHPVPSVLGAVALGVGIGFLLALSSRRHQPTFREHFVDEPLDAAREALYAVLAPVAHRIRGGYESARDQAERAIDKAHHFDGSRAADSVADQLRRVGGNLKFW